jgi:hypothetical protein
MEHDGEHRASPAEPLPGAFPSEPLDDETLSSELRLRRAAALRLPSIVRHRMSASGFILDGLDG